MTRHISKADIKQALVDSRGIVAFAARRLGVSRQTLVRRIEEDPSLIEVLEDQEAVIEGMAYLAIVRKVESGDVPTCCWYLDNFGQEHGYGVGKAASRILSDDEFQLKRPCL